MVEPTPAPPSTPSRVTNADIAAAAAADAPASPAAATSPVRLSFGGHDENKRLPSPNRGTKSPKKKVQRLSSSPHRRAFASRQPIAAVASVADGTDSSVSALFDTPRPSPTTVTTIDPQRLMRLQTIIKSIKTKPISAKSVPFSPSGKRRRSLCPGRKLMLFVKHTFQRYVKSLLNRTVRTHPKSSKKGTVPQDEYLELGNRLFAQSPKMRSLKGMARVGNFVGLAQRCKRFVRKYYIRGEIDKEQKVTRSGSHANQTPERKAIYKLFTILFGKKYTFNV